MARKKFIPDGDSDFASMARLFANQIKCDPAKYKLSEDAAQQIDAAVIEFRDALSKSLNRFTRCKQTTIIKDAARKKAVELIRKYGNLIRADDQISSGAKMMVRITPRARRMRKKKRLTSRPHLEFMGTTQETGPNAYKHILKFSYLDENNMWRLRPENAARLELFVELVAEDEPIPRYPGELSGGRNWYLRSFTRSPMYVEFPMPPQPMQVVYWGRWCDSMGNVGPFSQTVAARTEGWHSSHGALPNLLRGRQRQQRIIITSARKELPDYTPAVEEAGVDETRLLPDAA